MKIKAKLTIAAACAAIAATGVAGAPAAHAAASSYCNYTNSQPQLSIWSSGTAVKQVQCELNHSLWDADPKSSALDLVVDGSFGTRTDASVRKLQACAGIKIDGIVGPVTWGVLNKWTVAASYLC